MSPADHPVTKADVARLAHDIWEAEGRPEGRHLEHWRRAEAILAGPGARRPAEPRPQPPAQSGAAADPDAPEMPGPRNPEPIPPTNEEGYVAVPSESDTAAGALGDAPMPPPAKPRRRTKPDR